MTVRSNIQLSLIPTDKYPIGHSALPLSHPEHTVTISEFKMMSHAVSNQLYAEFVTAGGYRQDVFWSELGLRWKKSKNPKFPAFWGDARFDEPNQPVVGISWYEALAFATWLSVETKQTWQLPSEAQWEVSARGHNQPVEGAIHTANSPIKKTIPVDEGNQSWCGAINLLGNVWEWCSTCWGHNWQTLDYPYPYNPTDGREDLSGSPARVMRGGSWFDPIQESHVSKRARYLPGSRGSNIGFRLIQIAD